MATIDQYRFSFGWLPAPTGRQPNAERFRQHPQIGERQRNVLHIKPVRGGNPSAGAGSASRRTAAKLTMAAAALAVAANLRYSSAVLSRLGKGLGICLALPLRFQPFPSVRVSAH